MKGVLIDIITALQCGGKTNTNKIQDKFHKSEISIQKKHYKKYLKNNYWKS